MIPRDVSDQVDGAMELASRAQLDEAEGIALPLLEEYGDLDVVQHAVGVIRALQGRTDEALEHFGCAIAICPDFTEAWFNKACAHRERLEIGPMIRCFQTVVEIGDPDESHVREAAEEIRRLEEVIRDSDGLSLDRYLHLMDVFNGASTEMARGKWERAIAGFQKVLAENPRHVQSHGNIGLCCAFLGRRQEALASLDAALALEPGYELAQTKRAAVLRLGGGEALPPRFRQCDYYVEKHNLPPASPELRAGASRSAGRLSRAPAGRSPGRPSAGR